MNNPCPCIAQSFPQTRQVHSWASCPDRLELDPSPPKASGFAAAFEAEILSVPGGPFDRVTMNAVDYSTVRKVGRDHLYVETQRALLVQGCMGAWRGPNGESVEIYTSKLVPPGTMECLRVGQTRSVPFPRG
jgi:hypothetical protein